jgi:phenylacetate-CoA ligase
MLRSAIQAASRLGSYRRRVDDLMLIVRKMRKVRMHAFIQARAAEYTPNPSAESAALIQLDLLNREWARLIERVPFYSDLVATRRSPARFSSLAEFFDAVPVTTRAQVRAHGAHMRDRHRQPDFYRITGGSLSQPVHLPAWNEENAHTRYDMWLGRSWYSIDPSTPLFLLWGHAHTLGTGFRGIVNRYRRIVQDALAGYYRFSAYDLRLESLRQAATELIRFRPGYLLGYSVALDRFARANEGFASEFRRLGLKAVIATAESFPAADSVQRLEELFAAPVAMEYGSVETNVIAHTHPGRGYRVFWRSYLVEAVSTDSTNRGSVYVTSLYPRCFPLVRYAMGDEIELARPASATAGLLSFDQVIGRCNDTVRLSDGTLVHSEVFSHAVRAHPEVHAFQVIVSGDDGLRLTLVADALTEAIEHSIRGRLSRVHSMLGGIPIDVVSRLRQSVAGKTPMIVRVSDEVTKRAPARTADPG